MMTVCRGFKEADHSKSDIYMRVRPLYWLYSEIRSREMDMGCTVLILLPIAGLASLLLYAEGYRLRLDGPLLLFVASCCNNDFKA